MLDPDNAGGSIMTQMGVAGLRVFGRKRRESRLRLDHPLTRAALTAAANTCVKKEIAGRRPLGSFNLTGNYPSTTAALESVLSMYSIREQLSQVMI